MHDAPVPPRKLDKKVPRDLETIILKAIAKEAAHRYGTAEQLAEDLRRFLADKPVLARRSSPAEQAWRWCRRNPALATASALAIAARLALAQEEPTNVRFQLDVGWTRLALAAIRWKALHLDQADREWTAALVAMDAAIREQPGDSPLRIEVDNARIEVATKHLRLALWEDAVQPLDYVFQRKPASLARGTGRSWQFHGLLHLLAGDQAGFRASCAEFFKQFRDEDNKSSLYQACIAGAGALPAIDLQRLAEMAEKDLAQPQEQLVPPVCSDDSRRTGDHRRGLELLDQTRPEYAAANDLVGARAIILHHLGRSNEAQMALADADRYIEESSRVMLETVLPIPVATAESLILREVLRREAYALIDGKPAPERSYGLLARARVLGLRGRDSASEKALAAAMAASPGDQQVIAAASRILAEQGRESRTGNAGSRAFALLEQAISSHPDDVTLLRARAELLCERGDWERSAADLARMFQALKDSQPRWFVAGTWFVGPYPLDPSNPDAEIARSLPPESKPDPSQPVAGSDGKSTLVWKRMMPGADGRLDLAPSRSPTTRSQPTSWPESSPPRIATPSRWSRAMAGFASGATAI